MFRRALGIVLALALIAATGCGTKSTGGSLDDTLRYTPKDAAFVMVFDTDPDGQQWQQVDKLLAKFPFASAVKQRLKTSLNSTGKIDYDRDIRPQLGNPVVISAPTISGPSPAFVVAWKPKDEGKFRKLIEGGLAQKSAPIEGADTFRTPGGEVFALKDGTLVAGSSVEALTAALGGRHDDAMTSQQLDDTLGDLAGDALLKMTVDGAALYGGGSAPAGLQQLGYVRAQKSAGIVLRAEPDGLEFKFVNDTEDVPEAELPLASGPQPAPVIRRGGEIGIGLRDPARTIAFYEKAFQAIPTIGRMVSKQKAKLSRELGIDIDRDLVSQLHGNAYASVALDGGFVMRADLRDPAAAAATLKRAAPRVEKVAHGGHVTKPKGGAGLYSVTAPGGKSYAFGVVGKSFVFATDAARAAQFAGESPTTVPGTKGALVVAADARAVANKIAAQQGQGAAAQVVTGALGDLVGWAEWERQHSIGSLKLFIK